MAKKKKKDETEKNTANKTLTGVQKQVKKAALSAAKEGAPDWIKQKEKLSGKSTEKKAPDPTFGTNSVKVKATADGTDIKLDMPEKAVKNWVKSNVSQRAEKKKNAQARVKSWYGINATDDEADAICLGKYAVRSLSSWGD